MNQNRQAVLRIFAVALILLPLAAFAGDASRDDVKAMLERECTHLDKSRLFTLIEKRFPEETDKGITPDLFKIMEGVVKRTDFDTIPEEKTAEIMEMVYGAFKKGAPLEQLDRIFDVAYVKTVSADRLAAAAKALKEFAGSEVPEDIYEEFVYKSLEDGWDPEATPVLTRGLIYSVERGLTAQKMALVIMLDVRQGVLKTKSADQLVLDAIKLVREKEPNNWKPVKPAERELARRQEQKSKLEMQQKQAEQMKKQKEEEHRKAREELEKTLQAERSSRQRNDDLARMRTEQERRMREIQAMIVAYQNEIALSMQGQAEVAAAVRKQMDALDREKRAKQQQREEDRQKRLAAIEFNALRYGRTGRLNIPLLLSSVDRYLGTPYRYGGDSEAGIDCSAFTRKVYRDQGIELPRSAREQSRVGVGSQRGDVVPGDLVFFDPSIMGTISHVGVYIGDNAFAHASSSRGVTKSSLRERYYQKRFVQANRIFEQ